MTERERFIKALKREPLQGHVPTFELVYFLTMEKFGKVHPCHRSYHQWNQMSAAEKNAHLRDMAQLHVDIARTYHHSAILVHKTPNDDDALLRQLEINREISGDEFFIMVLGDPTHAIPDGNSMMDFSIRIYEDMDSLIDISNRRTDECLEFAAKMKARGNIADGFALCSDYCFNVNPFFTPDQFAEFVAPYLKQTIDEYRKLGFWTIKHTDGNINPILDQIVNAGPDALHSIDPQGYMNLADVRAKYSDRICTIGNVNCGLLQTGTQEEADADVRRCLHEGMDDGKNGFVFSTSNCVYTGLDLARYERMVEIWQNEGIYEKRPALAK